MVDMSSVRSQFSDALRLQQTRCEVYHRWDTEFQRVISGHADSAGLPDFILHAIVTDMQQVSTSLRALQNTVRQNRQDHPRKFGAERSFLDKWIDHLQRTEQHHYQVTVELFSALASHCGPNARGQLVVADPPAEGSGKEERKSPTAKMPEKVGPASEGFPSATDVKSSQQSVSMASHEQESSAHEREGLQAAVTAAAPAPVAPSPSTTRYSVHDRHSCVLPRVLPPRLLTLFMFVHCGEVDLLAGEDDSDEEIDEIGVVRISPARCGEVLEDVAYRYTNIRKRCEICASVVLPLWKRRKALQEEAAELCEELQCELSDLQD